MYKHTAEAPRATMTPELAAEAITAALNLKSEFLGIAGNPAFPVRPEFVEPVRTEVDHHTDWETAVPGHSVSIAIRTRSVDRPTSLADGDTQLALSVLGPLDARRVDGLRLYHLKTESPARPLKIVQAYPVADDPSDITELFRLTGMRNRHALGRWLGLVMTRQEPSRDMLFTSYTIAPTAAKDPEASKKPRNPLAWLRADTIIHNQALDEPTTRHKLSIKGFLLNFTAVVSISGSADPQLQELTYTNQPPIFEPNGNSEAFGFAQLHTAEAAGRELLAHAAELIPTQPQHTDPVPISVSIKPPTT